MKCGSENPEFSEDALEKEHGTHSITEVRENECPTLHGITLLDYGLHETHRRDP